jgi:hypothetical protein
MSIGCDRNPTFTPVEPPPPAAPSAEFSGTLPSSRDTGQAAYYNFLLTVKRGPKARVAMCTGPWSCFSKTDLVAADLYPVLDSYTLDPRMVPAESAVVLLATNLGDKKTKHYKMRPGPYLYSWIVFPDSPGATTSSWIMNETDTTTHVTTRVVGEGGPFTPCKDRPAATSDEAGLFKCGEAHMASSAIKRSGLGAFEFMGTLWGAAAFELFYSESPGWKSCPAGCCTLAEY